MRLASQKSRSYVVKCSMLCLYAMELICRLPNPASCSPCFLLLECEVEYCLTCSRIDAVEFLSCMRVDRTALGGAGIRGGPRYLNVPKVEEYSALNVPSILEHLYLGLLDVPQMVVCFIRCSSMNVCSLWCCFVFSDARSDSISSAPA